CEPGGGVGGLLGVGFAQRGREVTGGGELFRRDGVEQLMQRVSRQGSGIVAPDGSESWRLPAAASRPAKKARAAWSGSPARWWELSEFASAPQAGGRWWRNGRWRKRRSNSAMTPVSVAERISRPAA